MGAFYFTSDTHFNHKNIIKYCNRPFSNIEEMNEKLIENWNSKISIYNVVYFLGDLSFYNSKVEIEQLLSRLNGIKHLIIGNHDSSKVRNAKGWYSVKQSEIVEVFMFNKYYNFHLHHKIPEDLTLGDNEFLLHGHYHGYHRQVKDEGYNYKKWLDVGVDMHNYQPVELFELTRYFMF